MQFWQLITSSSFVASSHYCVLGAEVDKVLHVTQIMFALKSFPPIAGRFNRKGTC